MSILPVVLFCITVAGILAAVIFNWHIKIGKVSLVAYWVIALAGALLSVLAGFVSPTDLANSLFTDTAVNPLKILVLFISMTVISIFLDEAGFYSYVAAKTVKYAGKSQKKLFCLLFALTSVLTVFTSNDIIILTFTPFILYFSRRSKIDPIPFIFAEFVAANTWSMFFVFGNPTNIYISTAFGVTFGRYFSKMWLATLLAGLTSFGMLYLLFHKKLSTPMSGSDLAPAAPDRTLAAIGLLFLVICIIGLATASYIGFEMWLVALACGVLCIACATVYLLISGKGFSILLRTVSKLPWALIPFLLSMFILIISLQNSGMVDICAKLIPQNLFAYGGLSFLFSNVLNNIPMSVLFSALLNLSGAGEGAMYATVIGSNLGALFTPVGALAGIMWLNIIKTHGVKFGFGAFVKYGFVIAVPALLAALFGVWGMA